MTDTDQQNNTPERFTLRKSAKLRHRTLVQELFQKGRSVYSGPLRITFRALSEEELKGSFREAVPDLMGPVQFMITVPKKKRRHAVDRVLMRRRIREAYRLNRHQLLDSAAADSGLATVSMAFVYISDQKCSYRKIEKAMRTLLTRLAEALTAEEEISEK